MQADVFQITLQQLIDASPSAMLLVGADGRICAANAVAAQLFGWSIDELLARKVEDLVPERCRSIHREHRRRYDKHPRPMATGLNLRGLRADNTEFQADISLGPIDEERILVTVLDIGERERMSAALREREAQMRLFIQHAPVALAMFDRQMRYLAASQRWLADYGLTGQDVVGRSHYEVFPEIPERWRAVHQRGLQGVVERAEEDRFERADGSVQWLRWEIRPWNTSTGEVGGIIIFTEDITARKRAEEDRERLSAQIDRQRSLLQTIVDNMPIALALLDGAEHRYTLLNAAQAEIARGKGPLAGKTVAQVWPEDVDGKLERLLDQAYRSGEAAHLRDLQALVDRGQGPEESYFDIDCIPLRGEQGEVTGLLLVTADRSEQVQTRRKMEENEAAIHRLRSGMERALTFEVASQTVAAIAHDLNQPLNAVVSYSDAALRMLQRGNANPKQLERALQANVQQAQRAGQVVRELLDFLQKGESAAEPVQLGAAVAAAVAIAERDGVCDFQAVVDVAPRLKPVRANRQQIEKVLVNLLRNSAEAMRSAGTVSPLIGITVDTQPQEGMALVTVRDTGSGLNASALERAFEPFFTTKPDGLGMGLAISRSIIESYGGRLWADLKGATGATFRFTLPFFE